MSKKALQALLGDQIVGYHPILAKISGGAAEGVLLSQLLYWDSKMANARGASWDGWFWKVAREIYEETGMTRVEFETARTNLVKRGFIAYESRGVPMRAHYRIDLDKITAALESADTFAKEHARKFPEPKPDIGEETPVLQDTVSQFVENGHVENRQTDVPKMDTLDCRKSANQNAENLQTIQEITSLDSQQNSSMGGHPPNPPAAFSKTEFQAFARSLFFIPPEYDWSWLDAVWEECSEKQLLRDTAYRQSALGKPNSFFNQTIFTRMLRHAQARRRVRKNE
jgi:hypothetical protein